MSEKIITIGDAQHEVAIERDGAIFRTGEHAIEIVADRGSKATFDPALRLHARLKAEAMARGLMVYPSGGTADGDRCGRPGAVQQSADARSLGGSAFPGGAGRRRAPRPGP